MNLLDFDPAEDQQVYDVDLLAAGLPRLKSTATAASAHDSRTEQDLVRATIYLMHAVQPRALLVDNVPDMVTKAVYAPLRSEVEVELTHLGYSYRWLVVNAADVGVPQDRKHGVLLALKNSVLEGSDLDDLDDLELPSCVPSAGATVGSVLGESMATRGWSGSAEWAEQASSLAPTLVGGSWERGGADLGPTGSKRAWARMGVDGATVADRVPSADFVWVPSLGRSGMVQLTVDQAALLQGFPEDWQFAGRKTSSYRQVANAIPPPLARALGKSVAELLY